MHAAKNIALFASGTGSNVQSIINHCKNIKDIKPQLIVTNNPDAGVLKIAEKEGVESCVIKAKEAGTEAFIQKLKSNNIELIVLAGYLKMIPTTLIQAFPNKIINIHPSLLPKYGGKGMFGIHVHTKVVEMQETESGISIHYVNEVYDEGQIILQAHTAISPEDTPEMVAKKVLKLEHFYYPRVIEQLLTIH